MITVTPCQRGDCGFYRNYTTEGPIVTILDRRSKWEKFLGATPKGYALPICRDCKHYERFDLFVQYEAEKK